MLDEGLKAGQTKIFGPREYVQIYTYVYVCVCWQKDERVFLFFSSQLFSLSVCLSLSMVLS
jgi:hypothetical protein